jgi:hypothetical protein
MVLCAGAATKISTQKIMSSALYFANHLRMLR